MANLQNQCWETYAQALAAGMARRDARLRAGRARRDFAWALEATAASRSRVIELEAGAIGRSRDQGPVIQRLIEMSEISAGLGSMVGIREARSLLAEAARLKDALPLPQRPRERELTREEWHAKYPPRP